jgi:hypothetical protein
LGDVAANDLEVFVRTAKNVFIAFALGVGISASPLLSRADTLTVDFSQNNSCGGSLGCSGSGLLAVATITDIIGGVSVDITLKDSSFAFFQAGNPPMIGFQPTPTGLSGTSSAMDNLGGAARTWGLSGGFNSGGPGSFLAAVGYLPKGNIPFSFDIVFTLANVATSDFTANDSGYIMGLDMCRLGTGTDGCAGTGFVGGLLTTQPVPLPATLPLFATGLAGLGLLGWRRKRKTVAPSD